MYQKQDKLISVRMPADLVDKLDVVASRFSCYKRSDVLRAFVSQIFQDLSDSEISDLMRFRSGLSDSEKVLSLHDPES